MTLSLIPKYLIDHVNCAFRLISFQRIDNLPMLHSVRMHSALPCHLLNMSDRAVAVVPPFPPGMSRLERLSDELKLRIGFYLTAAAKPKIATRSYVVINDLFSDGPHWQQANVIDFYRRPGWESWRNEPEVIVTNHKYNDSVLALASTSSRLCRGFFIEHAEKYGLQNTLYRSIELGNIEPVRCAVKYGADFYRRGTKNPWKVTALQLAINSEQLPVILYLLRRGVARGRQAAHGCLGNQAEHRP